MTTRRMGVVLAALAIVGLACAGLLAWQAFQARDEIAAAEDDVGALQPQVRSGDVTQAAATVSAIQEHTAAARDHTTGPLWSAASVLPLIGDDVGTVRSMARLLDELATDVLDPLAHAGAAMDPQALQPQEGRIDLQPLQEAQPVLTAAHDELSAIQERARDLPKSGLTAQVARARYEFVTQLDEAAAVVSPISRAAQLMPAMLGAEGPRTYLLLFQNNAEVRATGGMPGAMAVVRADQGRISLAEQVTPGDIGKFDEPVVEMPADLKAMFGVKPAVYPQNVGFTPNWPWSAQTAAAMYKAERGASVDGVGAVDPVVLSHLLKGQGQLALGNGTTVTAETAVQTLLNGVYRDLEGKPAEQNALYASAARQVFSHVIDGSMKPETILSALQQGAENGRVMLWSAHDDEQDVLQRTALAGPLRPGGAGAEDSPLAGPDAPVVGVFLNSATPSKLDYYLKPEVTVSDPQCRAGDRVEYTVTLDLAFDTPADAASLPREILGPRNNVTGAQNRTQVLVYVSQGGGLGEQKVDGDPKPYGAGSDAGYATALSVVTLDPGQTRTISTEVLLPEENLPPVLRVTPTAMAPEIHPNGLVPGESLATCP